MAGKRLRILVAEDDFSSRRILTAILEAYGSCDTAVNGREAVEAFTRAIDEQKPYDLICLDIMMPEKDGQTVLREVRELEKTRNILGLEGVKIIMVTALDDFQSIKTSFREQCEGYLIKPMDRDKLFEQLKDLGLIT